MEEGRDALFPLGRIVATQGALAALEVSEEGAGPFLARHVTGDWGELDPEDRQANELAVEHGSRIMSVYRTAGGVKFWIMTEADRSSTCFLLPEEY